MLSQVVCAIEMHGRLPMSFSGQLLRHSIDGETLGEIIDDEVRFAFPTWTGTMVGFRFPDSSKGETIPGLHLHGIADDRQSGGHLRSMIVDNVTTICGSTNCIQSMTMAPTAIPTTPALSTSTATRAPSTTPPIRGSSTEAPIGAAQERRWAGENMFNEE